MALVSKSTSKRPSKQKKTKVKKAEKVIDLHQAKDSEEPTENQESSEETIEPENTEDPENIKHPLGFTAKKEDLEGMEEQVTEEVPEEPTFKIFIGDDNREPCFVTDENKAEFDDIDIINVPMRHQKMFLQDIKFAIENYDDVLAREKELSEEQTDDVKPEEDTGVYEGQGGQLTFYEDNMVPEENKGYDKNYLSKFEGNEYEQLREMEQLDLIDIEPLETKINLKIKDDYKKTGSKAVPIIIIRDPLNGDSLKFGSKAELDKTDLGIIYSSYDKIVSYGKDRNWKTRRIVRQEPEQKPALPVPTEVKEDPELNQEALEPVPTEPIDPVNDTQEETVDTDVQDTSEPEDNSESKQTESEE